MSSQRRRSKPKLDIISSLPDSLICHLLSFLPTKLAVSTSILSKRWSPLWQSVLTLDFDDGGFEDFNSFRHFVYSVIISRNPMLPIRSFSIKCGQSNGFNPHDLNRFVQAAVERGLENFNLDVEPESSDDLKKLAPSILRVFSCRTLVVLKLKKLDIYHAPNLVHFPSLKTLHLESIVFNSFAHFTNLLRGCPVLEDFHTKFVSIPDLCHDMEEFFKGFPKLVVANLSFFYGSFPFSWVHNAKFLCAELVVESTYVYPVPTFHNLTHVELIFNSRSWPEKWKLVVQVLQNSPKLQNLILEEARSDILSSWDKFWKDPWNDPDTVPECLSSQLRTCSLRGFYGDECELKFAEYILLNSKLLCTMTVKSNRLLDVNEKYKKLVALSSYPRGSVTCKLLFDP